MVLLVQGLFLHAPAVLALPSPGSSFSSSSSFSPSPNYTNPTPTVHTITFHIPSPFSETIFGTLYTQTDYTIYVEERVVNVPSATSLPSDFEGSPSVTIIPYTSTVTGVWLSLTSELF
ncbi:hypothetical protein K435DRAFT_851279 [Dendrothele bispora CBS 962.96]|uniref:Uncharacterized protein n=1 Tax=Dendrothele bispora (strain CBS 962.96) TaxID=1314807 RepID=A0A4V4HHV5_DENBC|nr:hypothetical protein K435DRAFT_851279 [Dendrothele bispora CBS 962.96]